MPYKTKESERIIAYADYDYKDFDSLEDYIIDCDLCERPLESIERCDEFALQFPKAEDIVDDLIERLYQEEIIPEDWDEIDVKNNLKDLDWFIEGYNKLVDEFNKRQNYNIYRANGVYVYPEYFKAEIYGTDPEIARVEDGRYYGQEEIAEVIDRINERSKKGLKEIKEEMLSEENKKVLMKLKDDLEKSPWDSLIEKSKNHEKLKQAVKEYFESHPELEVPKNEESGLPFWEDDFMMTHSED